MVRSIGADQVIDYTQEDFTQNVERYDLIFDAVAKRTFSDCKRAISNHGIYVTTEFSPVLALGGLWTSMTGSKKMVPLLAKPTQKDLLVLNELLEAGKVTPVIDRRYTLSEVPEALRYIGKGHARGKVVITTKPYRDPELHWLAAQPGFDMAIGLLNRRFGSQPRNSWRQSAS